MFDVKMTITIPIEIKNAKGNSIYEAVENSRKLLEQTLPLVVAEHYEEIKNEMIIALDTVREVKDARGSNN